MKRVAQKLAKACDNCGKPQIIIVTDIVSGDGGLDVLTLVGARLLITQHDKSNFSGNDGVLPVAIAQW